MFEIYTNTKHLSFLCNYIYDRFIPFNGSSEDRSETANYYVAQSIISHQEFNMMSNCFIEIRRAHVPNHRTYKYMVLKSPGRIVGIFVNWRRAKKFLRLAKNKS